jgi:hypothetical protein
VVLAATATTVPGTPSRFSSPARRVAVVATVATVAWVTGCSSGAHPVPALDPTATSVAAERFVGAWQRNLRTSWAVQETVNRTNPAGRTVAFPVRLAQRPPDHVSTGLGTVDARLGGRLVACGVSAAETLQCGQQGSTEPYDQTVGQQLARLRTYVIGPGAIYRVGQLGGCFELTLRLPSFPVPPYGRVAVFCFDPVSGAPAGTVISRDQATDRTVVTDAHSPAVDADLVLPTPQEMTTITKLVHKAEGG